MAQANWKKVLLAGQESIVDADISSIGQAKISGLTSALSGKVPTTRTVNGHVLSSNVTITKSNIDLGSVDNTADAAKPVSTAQQSALDLKAPLASPALTGHPTATTQSGGNNSTRIATTAFVANAVAGENELEEMEDVVISSVADNDIIAYNSGTSKYTNQNASELGIATTTQLALKQDEIGDDDLEIAHVSDLASSLAGKEPTITKLSAFNKNFGSGSSTVCQGNDSRLSDSRIASDVYAWAKAETKPSYTYSEVGALQSGHDASAVTNAKITNWDNVYSWYQTMIADDDGDNVIDTVKEIINTFSGFDSESVNLATLFAERSVMHTGGSNPAPGAGAAGDFYRNTIDNTLYVKV